MKRVTITIDDLIKRLEKEKESGETEVSLSGLGTLHVKGTCILATEPQM